MNFNSTDELSPVFKIREQLLGRPIRKQPEQAKLPERDYYKQQFDSAFNKALQQKNKARIMPPANNFLPLQRNFDLGHLQQLYLAQANNNYQARQQTIRASHLINEAVRNKKDGGMFQSAFQVSSQSVVKTIELQKDFSRLLSSQPKPVQTQPIENLNILEKLDSFVRKLQKSDSENQDHNDVPIKFSAIGNKQSLGYIEQGSCYYRQLLGRGPMREEARRMFFSLMQQSPVEQEQSQFEGWFQFVVQKQPHLILSRYLQEMGELQKSQPIDLEQDQRFQIRTKKEFTSMAVETERPPVPKEEEEEDTRLKTLKIKIGKALKDYAKTKSLNTLQLLQNHLIDLLRLVVRVDFPQDEAKNRLEEVFDQLQSYQGKTIGKQDCCQVLLFLFNNLAELKRQKEKAVMTGVRKKVGKKLGREAENRREKPQRTDRKQRVREAERPDRWIGKTYFEEEGDWIK